MSGDASIDVRGRRDSVPADVAGQTVQIRLTLEGDVAVYDGEQLVASHRVVSGEPGWVTVPGHHAALGAQTLKGFWPGPSKRNGVGASSGGSTCGCGWPGFRG